MARVVEQEMRFCKKCNKKTLHMRNSTQISWVMHLVLAIFTLGAWILVFLAIMLLKVVFTPLALLFADKWVCTVCVE